ncbi:MAG: acyl-CoA dehydrogenase [Gemmataceae bacterium]|nr:acyl-CoA dehydrogenase [Gemmataceae bacterium]
MALTKEQLEEQKKDAVELLFSGPQTLGFAKAMFFGHFRHELLFPYPRLSPEEGYHVEKAITDLREFAATKMDPVAIDREAEIPLDVVVGLGNLGILGMTAPASFGGRDFSQLAYTKVMEAIGGICSSTAVFVNAHHSIGIRALLLFGTPEQQKRWLGPLCHGSQIAAFALTEPEAGSDAANVQTTAVPSPDGAGYILNGEKRWITNGGIAQVLTVIARTPGSGGNRKKEITAFLVTPDMPGFEVVEKRMAKTGIRGTATGRLKFTNMFVPKENLLGKVGKGLKIALTVLDFGRTTFGASCTGAAKVCVEAACKHALSRVQFQQPIAEFELVQKKIAFMAAHAFAMEAVTSNCASLIDRNFDDYMLETAMLKVWSTEALWKIVNDTIQILGGKAYFLDQPYERMMRDARINMIGEGANDVLRGFIAVVGLKPLGDYFLKLQDAAWHPWRGLPSLCGFAWNQVKRRLTVPEVPVASAVLKPWATSLGKRVRQFALAVQRQIFRLREAIITRELIHERIADAACELYASSCVLARLDALLQSSDANTPEGKKDFLTGEYYLRFSDNRIGSILADMDGKLDSATLAAAENTLSIYRNGSQTS